MFKHYFELIENVSIWPIISLSIFFAFFLVLIFWLFKVDKNYIRKMKNLPLDDQSSGERESSLKPKILICLLTMITLPVSSFAQASTNSGVNQQTLVIWLAIIVVVIAILVLVISIYTLNVLKIASEGESTIAPGKQSAWQNLWERFNKRVPAEKEDTILLDHNYDGIRELDNHLPPWWTAFFYISIVFGVLYMFVYHVFNVAPLPGELYDIEIAEAKTASATRLAEGGGSGIDETTVTFTDDAAVIENGKKIFDMQCASCHRNDGGGSIGPNLTDAYWLHGGSINDIFKIIKYGVPQKGMISWEPLLSPTQMHEVSSYIVTLEGSDPPNPKEPQGELYQAQDLVQ